MNIVESKFKNPDKYIERLKTQITDLRWTVNALHKGSKINAGSFFLNWDNNEAVNMEYVKGQQLSLGDTLIIRAEVEGIEMYIADEIPYARVKYCEHLVDLIKATK